MGTPHSGHYPIERRAGEIERLRLQGEAMAFDAAIMLDQIGVGAGWRCLEVGCGPGGITDLLSTRVGPTGHVVGLDADPVFLDHARARGHSNVEFVVGDAYRTGLPDGSVRLAQRLYQLVRHAGLEDVHYRPFLVGVRSGDPMTDYFPATVESVRGTLLDKHLIAPGELETALVACRSHLADRDTIFTTVTVAQVWGVRALVKSDPVRVS